MLERLHIEESKVPKMCLDLYIEYGTTLAGLKVKYICILALLSIFSSSCFMFISLGVSCQALGYEFDDDEFHAYVHGRLPYEKLKPDPVLRNLLVSIPQRKIVCQKIHS